MKVAGKALRDLLCLCRGASTVVVGRVWLYTPQSQPAVATAPLSGERNFSSLLGMRTLFSLERGDVTK